VTAETAPAHTQTSPLVLVTGATGYIGGRLVPVRAEMRLPGLAWLELIVDTDDSTPTGRTVFLQRALFHPRGLAGHLYWKGISPIHGLVFGARQHNIAHAAESLPPGDHRRGDPPAPGDAASYSHCSAARHVSDESSELIPRRP
jgi:Protein of unknown function (DUF2867)